MPIKPLSEEYKEATQSSISKLFFNYFKHGKPIDPIILESIDFSETFKKTTYVSEGRNRFILNIEESIAQNLVSSLPDEAFLPYITSSWLQVSKDSSSNSNVISHLLYFQRYDVVKKFLDVSFNEAIEENNYDGFKNKLFREKCLGKIININHQLDHFTQFKEANDTESIKKYYDLLLYSLNKYQTYTEQIEVPKYFSDFNEKSKRTIDILKNLDSLLHICRVDHPTYSQSWQNNLFTHPNFMKFVDFFGNSNNFYLYNSPNANTAIESNNMKAINYWNNHNVINPGEIKLFVNHRISNILNGLYNSLSLNSLKNTIDSTIKFYDSLAKKNLLSLEDINEENKIFFLLGNKNSFSNQLINSDEFFNNFKISKIGPNQFAEPISLKNLILYNTFVNEIIEKNNIPVNYFQPSYYSDRNSQEKLYQSTISEVNLVSQLLYSQYYSYVNNFTITEKDIANFCTNFTSEATYLDISPNSLQTHLEYYTYHKTMDNKESSSKKIKI